MSDTNTYVTAMKVADLFVDHTYQRELDVRRTKELAAAWDPRMAGIVEVSERPDGQSPRFAVIDGQHRVAAAALLAEPPVMVVNVHSGLSLAEEAALFDKLNRQRRAPTTWDHWRSRKIANDETVMAIEVAVAKVKDPIGKAARLVINSAPKDGHVRCTSTLEKLAELGGPKLVGETLQLIYDCWDDRLDAYDAPIVHGVGLLLHYLGEPADPRRRPIDTARLRDVLLGMLPRQLKTRALALREHTHGSQAKLVAIAAMDAYNRKPGHRILVSTRTFGTTARNAHSSGGPSARLEPVPEVGGRKDAVA